jgi:hypothetical protein
VRALEPAVAEYEQLLAANAALAGLATDQSSDRRADASSSRAPTVRRSRRRRSNGPRAPRGANRAAVLRTLEERPGVSVAELASASGVGRTVLYGLLKTLEQRGEMVREQLPGGSSGYRLTPSVPTGPAPAPPEPPAS